MSGGKRLNFIGEDKTEKVFEKGRGMAKIDWRRMRRRKLISCIAGLFVCILSS
jgi:hypothetical protein